MSLCLVFSVEILADDCGDDCECECECSEFCFCLNCLPTLILMDMSYPAYDNIPHAVSGLIVIKLCKHDQEWYNGIDHPPQNCT